MKQLLLTLICVVFCADSSAQERYLDEIFDDVDVTEGVKYGENFGYLGGLTELVMDVYEPVGDISTERPVMIYTHAGSYLPQSILPFGTRKDPANVEMCKQLARRGWVAISASYRLGWFPFEAEEYVRSKSIMEAVVRASIDVKMCAKFLRKGVAEEGNPYKIDPDKIAVGGTNSGGYNAITVGYFSHAEEMMLDKFFYPPSVFGADSIPLVSIDTIGNPDGLGGLPGYNNPLYPEYDGSAQLVFTLGGAIGDTSWVNPGEPPLVAFHGRKDGLTPYNTDIVIVSTTGDPVVQVSGSRDLVVRANAMGVNDVFLNASFNDPYTAKAEEAFSFEYDPNYTFPAFEVSADGIGEGAYLFRGLENGFEPWAWYSCEYPTSMEPFETCPPSINCEQYASQPTGCASSLNCCAHKEKALAYIDTVMNYFAPRAMVALQLEGYEQFIDTSVQPLENGGFLKVSPNPASNQLKIVLELSSEVIQSVQLFDLKGANVYNRDGINDNNHQINRGNWSSGIYLLTISLKNGEQLSSRLVFQ